MFVVVDEGENSLVVGVADVVIARCGRQSCRRFCYANSGHGNTPLPRVLAAAEELRLELKGAASS